MAFISNGTTILDNGAFQASLGNLVLLSEQTASASASISFTTGIDSTYPIYKFEFIDIHPSSNDVNFQFNMSTDGGSNYNVTKTTTFFQGYHTEAGAGSLAYNTGRDLAQSTANADITREIGNLDDESTAGNLFLFNPSSTTFVKHYISRFQDYSHADASVDSHSAGYGNTTSAVDAIRFTFSSGNIDSGTIKLYGIKDS